MDGALEEVARHPAPSLSSVGRGKGVVVVGGLTVVDPDDAFKGMGSVRSVEAGPASLLPFSARDASAWACGCGGCRCARGTDDGEG